MSSAIRQCWKPLTARDLERLAALLTAEPPHKLPNRLRALALTLQAGGEKGEQEGYL